jgi:hypothetical protein
VNTKIGARKGRRKDVCLFFLIISPGLRRQGHTSDCAENGVEAVAACASQRYDLILMVSRNCRNNHQLAQLRAAQWRHAIAAFACGGSAEDDLILMVSRGSRGRVGGEVRQHGCPESQWGQIPLLP